MTTFSQREFERRSGKGAPVSVGPEAHEARAGVQGRWQDLDWAARAVSVAARLCEVAGVQDVADRLIQVHGDLLQRRDRT